MLTGILGPIPKAEYSHNAAWARMWSKMLDVEIVQDIPDSGDVVLYFNINFDGSTLNLFGGLSEQLYNRLEAFINSKAHFTVVDHPIPDLGKTFMKRLDNKTTYNKFSKNFLNELSKKCKSVSTIKMTDFAFESMIIGDSHSMSFALNNMMISRNDGKTMNGICNNNDFIITQIPKSVKDLTLCFGSIDIRHHLFRLSGDPYSNAKTLLQKYKSTISSLKDRGLNITVCAPVPVETEARKMAETTKYKGNPFTGSRTERLEMTKYFIDFYNDNFDNVVTYPMEWYDMDPEEFEKTIMERPKSIHIGWPYYRINNFGKKEFNYLDDW